MPATLQRVYGFKGTPRDSAQMYQEADSQTFKVGDPLVLDPSTGKVAIFVASGSTYDSTTSATVKLLGIALANGRNTTNPGQRSGAPVIRDVPVMVFDDNFQFMLPVYDATAANTNYSLVLPGMKLTMRNQGGVPCAVIAGTSNPVIQVVDKFPGVADTETFYWAWFKVITAQRSFN